MQFGHVYFSKFFEVKAINILYNWFSSHNFSLSEICICENDWSEPNSTYTCKWKARDTLIWIQINISVHQSGAQLNIHVLVHALEFESLLSHYRLYIKKNE